MAINAILPKLKTENTIVFLPSLFSNEDKLILAPLQNLTNLFFRRTFSKYFPQCFDYALTPFISACSNSIKRSSPQFFDILPENNQGLIDCVPQIIGNNAEYILQTCKVIESLGYREVNINMGCPKKDIVSRGRGAGMLKNADLIKRITGSILNNTSLQVSLKVRLGVKENTDFEKLIPMLNSLPLKNICIHPRRAVDFYEGEVDLPKFEELVRKIRHTVIYNGDIFTLEDFSRLKQRFPFITHWMIGRGALRNPFLAGNIRGISYEKSVLLKPFIFDLEENFISNLKSNNEKLILGKMKEIMKYVCQGLETDNQKFLHSNSLEEINKFISEI
ncbi:MAG: tRNA-dihydrouridine synthase family protein [Bacteroidales bacterium]|nr:tRNA-dihydrouridine synthase family protein [Bacteroidales bacterium]